MSEQLLEDRKGLSAGQVGAIIAAVIAAGSVGTLAGNQLLPGGTGAETIRIADVFTELRAFKTEFSAAKADLTARQRALGIEISDLKSEVTQSNINNAQTRLFMERFHTLEARISAEAAENRAVFAEWFSDMDRCNVSSRP